MNGMTTCHYNLLQKMPPNLVCKLFLPRNTTTTIFPFLFSLLLSLSLSPNRNIFIIFAWPHINFLRERPRISSHYKLSQSHKIVSTIVCRYFSVQQLLNVVVCFYYRNSQQKISSLQKIQLFFQKIAPSQIFIRSFPRKSLKSL